jgi:LPS-assembly protein
VKFSALFLIPDTTFARETFEFNLGQKINILSDKAFRKTRENEFEAVGNVVITHMKNSIYGERARINFTSGDTEVEGNVRYISPGLTLYGTKLKYNFLTREIDLVNARMLSDNYVLIGKRILQSTSQMIYADEAEYTTCKDCPESWSIFGKKVAVKVGQYVEIKHAFFKVNGVVVMYFPYIIFPIKVKRESGILFPMLGFSGGEGFRYQQPIFWAIDDFTDLTATPTSFGIRGTGGDLQFRHNFSEKTWIETNSLFLNDQIYEPYKQTKEQSGKKYSRYFSNIEQHSIYKHYLNQHFTLNNSSDLDMKRDFDTFTSSKIKGTEIGAEGFIEGRNSYFDVAIEGYFNNNLLISNPQNFDNQYVQILPKLSLTSVPLNLFDKISTGIDSDYTIFKQNNVTSAALIRNARRLNLTPYAKWQIGNLGPVYFSHQTKWDYQNYYFPFEKKDKYFSKQGFVFESEMKVELEKIFGIAFEEPAPVANIFNKSAEDSELIGNLPNVKPSLSVEAKNIVNHSYRHSQEIKFKHYYLSSQQSRGNEQFKSQIQQDNGQFDYVDAVRSKEYLSNQVTSQDSLPLSNTLEFQWNNAIIRKTAKSFNPFIDGRYLKDNFSYENMSFLDVSQGLDFNLPSVAFYKRLTRLYVNTGFAMDRLSFTAQEFYFHQQAEHKFTTTASYNFGRGTLGGTFTYNSFNSSNTPITKYAGVNYSFNINDLLLWQHSFDYDIHKKSWDKSLYSILYSPLNHCWKLEFNYSKDLIEKKVGLLFYINYNENNFTPFNVK